MTDIHEAQAPRWSFRVAAEANDIVRRAATICHRNLTQFVTSAAVVEAERVLADQREFALPQEKWDAFMRELERPVQENPGLAKLFEKPSVFS
jgi:uncharacterized protein (DUF1778 family)